MVALFRSRRSTLDTWLLVAFSGGLIQSLLILTLHGRFTAGWYWLYLVNLVSHLVVMLVLIAESNRLYLRLALSTAAREREREARLMSLDAVAASISHEAAQPVAGVVLNATAGLKWLTRQSPDVPRAIASLRATLDAARRSSAVMKSIRDMFGKTAAERVEFSLNDLVRETTQLLTGEMASEKLSVELELDEALPLVLGDRTQIQRVLTNLIINAIEAVAATRGRPRRIVIRSRSVGGHGVLLEVSDTGPGIASDAKDRLFETFFTTKPTGTGLGLPLSRMIVREHGGDLWASAGEVCGATFHLELPGSGEAPPRRVRTELDVLVTPPL
jgi:signal transduction histidine kinase